MNDPSDLSREQLTIFTCRRCKLGGSWEQLESHICPPAVGEIIEKYNKIAQLASSLCINTDKNPEDNFAALGKAVCDIIVGDSRW
jgi:hypothetical protein